jgi:hypothetical protein
MAANQMTLIGRQRIARDTMVCWFDTNGASFEFQAGQHADFILTHPCMGTCEFRSPRVLRMEHACTGLDCASFVLLSENFARPRSASIREADTAHKVLKARV